MVVLTIIGTATKVAYKTGKFAVGTIYKGTKFVGKKAYNMTRRRRPQNKSNKKTKSNRRTKKSR